MEEETLETSVVPRGQGASEDDELQEGNLCFCTKWLGVVQPSGACSGGKETPEEYSRGRP
ncbi:putative serine/threonine protein kinase IRE4 [Clarias magur]|uniref:Putative serine/threonine protein kinase IRE4 n=1 Tax=Clarias magur TaxID=1594786 RepID=A0A8J4TCI0_CLAMG|nr:putative serine/threonine protein kinase IRE4 [Clarias magur]